MIGNKESTVLAVACICAFTLLPAACSRQADSTVESAGPDLVVINADVRTVDSSNPGADAFAVTGGKFVAVGSADDIRPLARANTEIIDAGGVTIIPGLIDGHTHLLNGSALAVGVDLSEIESKDEWLRIIRDKAQTLPEGDWIIGGAWDHTLSDGVLPTKEMLDSVAPGHPVWLQDIDHHSAWANSLAIELAEITAATDPGPGGEIMIDPRTGELSGIFIESAAYLFSDAPGMAEALDPLVGIRAAVAYANSVGITAVHDMPATTSVREISDDSGHFLTVMKEGALTLRVWHGVRPPKVFEEDALEIYATMAANRESLRQRVEDTGHSETMGPLLDVGYTKIVVDGVLSTYTALMNAPYSDNPQANPEPITGKMRLDAMVAAAHQYNFPVSVHAIGDRAVAWTLDAFAKSSRPAGLPMDRIEHIEVVTPDDVQRFSDLGIAASMQPHHATCCVGNYVIDRIGRERLPNAYVWRSILDAEVPLVLGSDWSTSPLNPLRQMADTLHRETRIDGVVRPWDEGNTLTFEEALYGYSQAGANMTAWADEIGSISVGKWADFVVLDSRVPEDVSRSLQDLQVTATYLAGNEVYPR